jgi:hypothetical protein
MWMHFIESFFGISPDGGNGMSEVAIVVSIVLAAGLYWKVRRFLRVNRTCDLENDRSARGIDKMSHSS